jgi:hypothetical protein
MSRPDQALARLAARLCPGFVAVDVRPLGPDRDIADDTHKAVGYGAPQRIILRDSHGNERSLVRMAGAASAPCGTAFGAFVSKPATTENCSKS